VEGREREGPKLLLNQGPSEPCYATVDSVDLTLYTVDDSRDPPQQQNDKNSGGFLSLLARHATQKDDVDCERRNDYESVKNLRAQCEQSA